MPDKMGFWILADQNQPARKTYEGIYSNTTDACLLAADKQYFSVQVILIFFFVIVNTALPSSSFFFRQVKPKTEFRLIIFYNYISLREQVVQDWLTLIGCRESSVIAKFKLKN